ncbi:MAG: hypothetical protein HY819_18915 [Acidobacteria bacterium]|nr:hypothetical protein [Acidobacteriota bacterium]
MGKKRSWIILLFTLAFAYLFTWIFLTPFCGLVFHCGCTWLWAGAAEKCVGAMDTACTQHICPWCDDGKLGIMLPFIFMLVSQTVAILFVWWKYHFRYIYQLIFQILIGIVIFIFSGYLEAVIHGLIKNYPR